MRASLRTLVPTAALEDRRPASADDGRPASADDAGLSTIEVVILAPVMILFILVLVGFGQLVDGAGSIQKDHGTAIAEAKRAAEANLADVCSGPVSVVQKSAGFEPDTLFTVEVSCEVRGLAMIGLDIPTTLSATFSSPLDPYRRTA
jgi:hypothetical protein